MKAREVIRIIKRDGWYQIKNSGSSHLQFKHPTKKGRVTVPFHNGDMDMRTVKSVLEQAQIDLRGIE